MQILRQLPFRDTPSTVEVAGEVVSVKPYQVIVWVSLSIRETLEREAPIFPAVLDTGHNHNFSIAEELLVRWAGIDKQELPKKGAILVNRQEVPLLSAHLWIRRNRPRTTELLPKPYPLQIPEGISVFPDGMPGAPRLPLLGLRGLVRNELRLVIGDLRVSLGEH